MYKANNEHRQYPLMSQLDSLSEKRREELEESWAGTFYRDFFCLIDEKVFDVLYSDKPSRPNTAVNVLVAFETLKAGLGYSDNRMYATYNYDMQIRYALGYHNLGEGEFELRTIYNFRRRLSEYMQETGINLIEKSFEQITDEQMKAFQLKTGNLRMDSTQIASNIREMSRLQLLVEVLQRVHRMLSEQDQDNYQNEFEPYLRGTSGQYVYNIKGEKAVDHLQPIGKLMYQLVQELSNNYGQEPAYQLLVRVFQEHFTTNDTGDPSAKDGKELSAGSLQSPDDQEATYRCKRNKDYRGYVANVTETCDPDNDFQLINKVQVEPNTTEDTDMLIDALPNLKDRTDVEKMNVDGGYGSAAVDEVTRKAKVELIQTAIRGRKPAKEKLGLEDFDLNIDKDGKPQEVSCPYGQIVAVQPGRSERRYLAYFDRTICNGCPLARQCPTKPLKRNARQVLHFSQEEIGLALRRKLWAEARGEKQNLRAAVESTVRSVKHPFRQGKLPVRGKPRVSMMVIASAAMTNIRRIQRYEKRKAYQAKTNQKHTGANGEDIFAFTWDFVNRVIFGKFDFKSAVAGI